MSPYLVRKWDNHPDWLCIILSTNHILVKGTHPHNWSSETLGTNRRKILWIERRPCMAEETAKDQETMKDLGHGEPRRPQKVEIMALTLHYFSFSLHTLAWLPAILPYNDNPTKSESSLDCLFWYVPTRSQIRLYVTLTYIQ